MTLDVYHTPAIVVNACLERAAQELRLDDYKPQYILDPGAGFGAWGMSAHRKWPHAHLTGVEIRNCPRAKEYDEWHEANFITWETQRQYDLVIGNPPFSLGEMFINKALKLTRDNGHICMLMRLAYLESSKRYGRFWSRVPLKHVSVLVHRPSFTGPGVDMAAYGFFMFKCGYTGPATLSWTDWKGNSQWPNA